VSRTAQTWSRKPPTVELDHHSKKRHRRIGDDNAWIRPTWNFGGDLLDSLDRQETMNNNKRKKVLSNTIDISVLTEMAQPRMSKSARIAEQNLDAARIPEQPRIVIPGTVEKLIPSPRPNQPEKAQIAFEGDHGYRDLRIENSLTDEYGDEVKLKKGASVEVTVATRPDVVKR